MDSFSRFRVHGTPSQTRPLSGVTPCSRET